MRTITFESKSPPACCKFLEVREIKLITQPTVSVNRLFSRKISPSTHLHTHKIKHMHTTGAGFCKEQGLFFPFYKIVIRLSQDHTDSHSLLKSTHMYKVHLKKVLHSTQIVLKLMQLKRRTNTTAGRKISFWPINNKLPTGCSQ